MIHSQNHILSSVTVHALQPGQRTVHLATQPSFSGSWFETEPVLTSVEYQVIHAESFGASVTVTGEFQEAQPHWRAHLRVMADEQLLRETGGRLVEHLGKRMGYESVGLEKSVFERQVRQLTRWDRYLGKPVILVPYSFLYLVRSYLNGINVGGPLVDVPVYASNRVPDDEIWITSLKDVEIYASEMTSNPKSPTNEDFEQDLTTYNYVANAAFNVDEAIPLVRVKVLSRWGLVKHVVKKFINKVRGKA